MQDGSSKKMEIAKLDNIVRKWEKSQELPVFEVPDEKLRERVRIAMNYRALIENSGWMQLQVKRNSYFDRKYLAALKDMTEVSFRSRIYSEEDDHIKFKIWEGEEAEKELKRRAETKEQ